MLDAACAPAPRLVDAVRFLGQRIAGDAIRAGAAAAERGWRLERAGGEPVLSIEGDYGVICRLRLDHDGVWRGRWLQFEQMPIELISLG